MKQVKGYTKEDYIKSCIEQGGKPVEYPNIEAAAKALLTLTKNLGGHTENPVEDIENDTNCDWVIMEDGTVLFQIFTQRIAQAMREEGLHE